LKTSAKNIKRSKFIGLETISFILRPIHTSLISLLIIRLFDIDLWGKFVVFLVGVELLTTLLNWGQKPFLIRAFSLKPSDIGDCWGKTTYSRISILILIVFLLWLIPVFQPYFFPLLLWTSFKWFSFLFDSIIQFYRKYWWSISAEIVAISSAVLSVFFFSEEMNLEVLIYIFAFSAIAKFIVLSPLLREWKVPSLSITGIKKDLQLSFPFFALSIAGLVQTKGDLYVAAYLLPEQDLAAYQVIIGFLLLGQTFSAIILGPFQKNIYRWQGNDFSSLKKLYLKIGFISTVLLSIGLYFGLQYIYLIDLNLWHLLLFFAYLFPLYTYLIESQILLKHKNEKQLLHYNLIAAVCNIVIGLLLVSWYGIFGALLSGIICRLVLAKLVVGRSKIIRNGSDI